MHTARIMYNLKIFSADIFREKKRKIRREILGLKKELFYFFVENTAALSAFIIEYFI